MRSQEHGVARCVTYGDNNITVSLSLSDFYLCVPENRVSIGFHWASRNTKRLDLCTSVHLLSLFIRYLGSMMAVSYSRGLEMTAGTYGTSMSLISASLMMMNEREWSYVYLMHSATWLDHELRTSHHASDHLSYMWSSLQCDTYAPRTERSRTTATLIDKAIRKTPDTHFESVPNPESFPAPTFSPSQIHPPTYPATNSILSGCRWAFAHQYSFILGIVIGSANDSTSQICSPSHRLTDFRMLLSLRTVIFGYTFFSTRSCFDVSAKSRILGGMS